MTKEKLKIELDKLNSKSSLDDLQRYIKVMLKENDFNNTPLELLCFLIEEVGELAKEIRKNEANMQMDIDKKNFSSISDELADVCIYVLTIADKYDLNLLEALKKKEVMNLDRIWK